MNSRNVAHVVASSTSASTSSSPSSPHSPTSPNSSSDTPQPPPAFYQTTPNPPPPQNKLSFKQARKVLVQELQGHEDSLLTLQSLELSNYRTRKHVMTQSVHYPNGGIQGRSLRAVRAGAREIEAGLAVSLPDMERLLRRHPEYRKEVRTSSRKLQRMARRIAKHADDILNGFPCYDGYDEATEEGQMV